MSLFLLPYHKAADQTRSDDAFGVKEKILGHRICFSEAEDSAYFGCKCLCPWTSVGAVSVNRPEPANSQAGKRNWTWFGPNTTYNSIEEAEDMFVPFVLLLRTFFC